MELQQHPTNILMTALPAAIRSLSPSLVPREKQDFNRRKDTIRAPMLIRTSLKHPINFSITQITEKHWMIKVAANATTTIASASAVKKFVATTNKWVTSLIVLGDVITAWRTSVKVLSRGWFNSVSSIEWMPRGCSDEVAVALCYAKFFEIYDVPIVDAALS